MYMHVSLVCPRERAWQVCEGATTRGVRLVFTYSLPLIDDYYLADPETITQLLYGMQQAGG
jgi:hypothetical protein